jgi:hypothetical protein
MTFKSKDNFISNFQGIDVWWKYFYMLVLPVLLFEGGLVECNSVVRKNNDIMDTSTQMYALPTSSTTHCSTPIIK